MTVLHFLNLGAGKTTTMSMLTGMFPPSSGTAIINEYDIRKNIQKARSSIGLCPQHNILFDELTVREHIEFYSLLKGLNRKDVEEEVKRYVELLELEPKINAPSASLSGGMQRKLSVGVALCGQSRVVFCDEPTSGMSKLFVVLILLEINKKKKNRFQQGWIRPLDVPFGICCSERKKDAQFFSPRTLWTKQMCLVIVLLLCLTVS